MVCPRCGCEWKEGHLYCDSCGMEIQMVPDFEPEIENSITETLSTVAEEIEGSNQAQSQTKKINQQDEDTADNSTQKEKKEDGFFHDSARGGMLPIMLITFCVVVVIVIVAGVMLYHRYSSTYQIQQAKKLAETGNYEQAVMFLDEARKLEPENADIALVEAEYLLKLENQDRALTILLEVVDRAHLEYTDKERVFESIIEIYNEREEYEKINKLLVTSGDLDIQNHFQQYMALAPEFGYESGTYEEVLLLRMSANTSGTIYYTTDGSMPDEHSNIYTTPLILEAGEFQIFAIFVNDYGIKSELTRGWFVINLTVPDPPQISLTSGDYNLPSMIEVEAQEGCTVYYTTDGQTPTKDSLQYTAPIFMPLGRTNYKFIAVSEEGVSSEVVSRSYSFALETEITIDRAIRNVVQALFDRKVLLDLYGHSTEIQGKYVFAYDTIVEIPNLGYYYVLNEYIEDETGNRTETGRLYAVEVYIGAPNRLIYDENGEMGLISLTE